jgi:RNA polymerase sigma factor for flagellar operon FliA
MLDELRQMDHLQRDDRRKVKALQIARDRWTTLNGTTATLAELSSFSSTGVDEIARLDALPASLQSDHLDGDVGDRYRPTEAVTEEDEIEARVDTEIVLRRLEKYFATLPVRDREVIDAYLGIGLTPTALAHALDITPSRVSQLFKDVCTRVARHFGNDMKDVGADRRRVSGAIFEQQIAAREARAAASNDVHWGVLIEQALTGQRAKDNATGRHRAG